MSLVWIWKPVISRIKEDAMSLLVFSNVFLCCCHGFNPSLCRLLPLLLSYVTVSRPCRLSKFLHQQGLTIKYLKCPSFLCNYLLYPRRYHFCNFFWRLQNKRMFKLPFTQINFTIRKLFFHVLVIRDWSPVISGSIIK